jgi:hypothetical protein
MGLQVVSFVLLIPGVALSQTDNGIHVGRPKVYDTRALQLMMDDLAKSLQGTSMVDPKALAAALGNVQGFSSTDLSQGFMANGAVGPQAASVFAGSAGAANPAATGTTTSPTVSINIAPTMNAGTAGPAAASSAPAGTGPQPPALPALQTAPTYNPNFGPSGGDLLADEANLTYQLFNLRMMLERALSDRLYKTSARLQAVLGFDIDIEPASAAKNAVANVDVTVQIDCHNLPNCNAKDDLSIVALMPEEGSHNAATLSQKATGFGGALASAVFSVGYSVQKRSQTFYVYRDMDTVSYAPPSDSSVVHFGWQFRPVLGRPTVAAGRRHLIVVLSLPSADDPADSRIDDDCKKPKDPGLSAILTANVTTSWKKYDSKLQATNHGARWPHALPKSDPKPTPFHFEVPATSTVQDDLGPCVSQIDWVPTNAANGVAIVSGKNFFPGTTVRFGNKTYASSADGLVIKSDQELEVTLPSVAAAWGGEISGRYGRAISLVTGSKDLPGYRIAEVDAAPTGNSLYFVTVVLQTLACDKCKHPPFGAILDILGLPTVLLNGAPPANTPSLYREDDKLRIQFAAPAAAFSSGAEIATMFPFAGPEWMKTMPYFVTTLNVARLSGTDVTTLIISANDPGAQLCTGWSLSLDGKKSYSAGDSELKCLDRESNTVALTVKNDDLKSAKRFVMTKMDRAPLQAEIPKSDAPSPAPVVDKTKKVTVQQYDVVAVTFQGTNFDKVTKVLFDKVQLDILEKDAKHIVIGLTRDVTDKPRSSVDLQLLSDGNDPVVANLTITPSPEQKGK